MPATKKGSKWAAGPRGKAVFKTKKQANKAIRAIHARGKKRKKR